MAWFKVDDRLHSSRKVLSIPRPVRLPAMGLWVMCGSWVSGEGTDGWVPDYIVEEFGGTPDIIAALLDSGLWISSDKGPTFHAWTEYNPDSETVQAGKAAQSEGAKHANHKRWHVKRRVKVPGCEWCFPSESGADQIPDRSTDGEANPPDPARPDPTNTPSSTKKEGATRGSRVPDPFVITDELRSWAEEEAPLVDIDRKTAEFVDYWAAVPGQKGVKLDWSRTWKNDMRKKQEFAERDRAKSKPARRIPANDEWMYR